jgi:hypothetical protein
MKAAGPDLAAAGSCWDLGSGGVRIVDVIGSVF